MDSLIRLLPSLKPNNSFNTLKRLYNPQNIKIIYHKKGYKYETLMFTPFDIKRGHNELFGTIIALRQNRYEIVSIAAQGPRSTQPDESKRFTAVEANDGTTVTLYYVNNKWAMSTSNSYDVSEYVRKDIKFIDALNAVMETYPEFSYEKLSKDKSYTIGFRHPSLHPFIDDEKKLMRAWFIQSSDLVAARSGLEYINESEDIGIPFQVEENSLTIEELRQLNSNALAEFIKSKTVNYGFIVKQGGDRYMMESTLLQNIRELFYNTTSSDRRRIIEVFVGCERYATLKQLFPQYEDIYKKIEDRMEQFNGIVESSVDENRTILLEISKTNSFVDSFYEKVCSES